MINNFKGTLVLILLLTAGTILCYQINGRPLNLLSYIGVGGIGLATFYNEWNEYRTKK